MSVCLVEEDNIIVGTRIYLQDFKRWQKSRFFWQNEKQKTSPYIQKFIFVFGENEDFLFLTKNLKASHELGLQFYFSHGHKRFSFFLVAIAFNLHGRCSCILMNFDITNYPKVTVQLFSFIFFLEKRSPSIFHIPKYKFIRMMERHKIFYYLNGFLKFYKNSQ